jgi:hypothetical protein
MPTDRSFRLTSGGKLRSSGEFNVGPRFFPVFKWRGKVLRFVWRPLKLFGFGRVPPQAAARSAAFWGVLN